MKIKEIENGKKFEGFLLVKKVEQKETKDSEPFVEIICADNEQDVSCKIWKTKLEDLEEIESSDIIKIIGTGNLFDGKMNLSVKPIEKKGKLIIPVRKAIEKDNINLDDLIKSAKENPEDMMNHIYSLIEKVKDEEIKIFTGKIVKDHEEDLKIVAGGKSVHHDFRHGLLYHIFRILKSAEALLAIYNLNYDILIPGIILHDIGKIPSSKFSKLTGLVDEYTKEGALNGHIVEGIKILQKYDLNESKKLLFEHIIASHHYHEQWGSFTQPAFKEAEIIHHLDMIDSRLSIMEDEFEKIEESEKTPKVWSLEKRYLVKV